MKTRKTSTKKAPRTPASDPVRRSTKGTKGTKKGEAKKKPTNGTKKGTNGKAARRKNAANAAGSAGVGTGIRPLREIPFWEGMEVLSQIWNPYNARTQFEDADQAELVASIQEAGIQTRLWIYPTPEGGPNGEPLGLIAGERRQRAALSLGMVSVPVKNFYDATPEEAEVLGLLDNLQRKQLTILEQARAIVRLRDERGLKVWEPKAPQGSIGHLLGYESKTKVYAVLKLMELGTLGQEALAKGELSQSVAVRLARIGNPEHQAEATREAISRQWTDETAAQEIERRWSRELKGAPFDPEDASLNPERGGCGKCPWRSGNQAELFGELAKGRGDVCTDPACYRVKCEASWEQRASAHVAAGGKVLTAEEGPAMGLTKWYDQVRGYVNLDEVYGHIDDERPAREVFAAALKRGELSVTLARSNTGSGKVFELVNEEAVYELAKKLGLIDEAETGGGGGPAVLSEAWKREKEERLQRAKVEEAVCGAELVAIHERLDELAFLPWLKIIARTLAVLVEVYGDELDEFWVRHGRTLTEAEREALAESGEAEPILREMCAGLETSEAAMRLITDLAEFCESYRNKGELRAALSGLLGIDRGEIERGVRLALGIPAPTAEAAAEEEAPEEAAV